MTVAVRRATPGDLDAVLALVEQYCAVDGHTFDAVRARNAVAPLLDHDRVGVVWLAELDGRITAYAAVTWGWSIEIGGFEAVLDEIYSRERGAGVGSELINALERDCRDRGARRILLETEQPNDDARRLYRRHGYADDASIWLAKELT